jgi:hypothetical protein
MTVDSDVSGGDIVRGVVGAVAAMIVLAVVYEPSIRRFLPKVAFFGSIVIACVVTARSKGGVLAGIGADHLGEIDHRDRVGRSQVSRFVSAVKNEDQLIETVHRIGSSPADVS